MYKAVLKFFALHHHLSLPGIGNFSIETQPAQIDFTNRSITSSKNKIVFNNDKLPAEKMLYDFLSLELNTDEARATQSLAEFTEQLQRDLDNNNSIYFEGIGSLSKQTADVLTFQPEEIPEYFPPLVAERIIRKNTTHTVRVGEDEKTSDEMQTALLQPGKIRKEKWWITAVILAATGIAAIAFYYATHK
jgi:nucleoid DNA-binding protein